MVWFALLVGTALGFDPDSVVLDDPNNQDVQIVLEPVVADVGIPNSVGAGATLRLMDGRFPLGLDARGSLAYVVGERLQGVRDTRPKLESEGGLSLVLKRWKPGRLVSVVTGRQVIRGPGGTPGGRASGPDLPIPARVGSLSGDEMIGARTLLLLRGGAQYFRSGVPDYEVTVETFGAYAGLMIREDRHWVGKVRDRIRGHARTYTLSTDLLWATPLVNPRPRDIPLSAWGARLAGTARFVPASAQSDLLGVQISAELGVRPWLAQGLDSVYAQVRLGLSLGGGKGRPAPQRD